MKKTTQLRKMIESPEIEFIMEAHNGLSAKIVQEAGFKGIWASGLSISAALGVRDNNEASWTQVLEVCEFMSDATTIPILLDGDTGFGNFNSFRRLITKLEQRGIAGVCIEDKIFPKTNSFIGGEKQPLAVIDEFCGKIKAGKDSRTDPDFVIVARVEALIAGWGIDEALARASAYAAAGADAVLIHSKIASFSEIEAFLELWKNRKPVVIVPTMYYKTPTQVFRDRGVSLVIWANHALRAAVNGMQNTIRQIHCEETLLHVEDKIAPVKEIFRLQNVKEYEEAEARYLPQRKSYRGLILAASKGSNFGTLTEDKPKTMIKIGNDTILSKIVRTFNNRGIKDIHVVVGYGKDKVTLPNLKYIANDEYNVCGLLYSLYLAKPVLEGDLILSFGDILFDEDILRKLTAIPEDIVLAVDTAFVEQLEKERDLVKGGACYSEKFGATRVCKAVEMKETADPLDVTKYDGEFIGVIKFSAAGSGIAVSELERLEKEDPGFLRTKNLTDFVNLLIARGHPVHLCYFRGQWKDIDSIEDLTYLISQFAAEGVS